MPSSGASWHTPVSRLPQVNINHAGWQAATGSTITIDGLGGYDEVIISGTTGDDGIEINRVANQAVMPGPYTQSDYSITLNNFQKFTAHGGGGANDMAQVSGSPDPAYTETFTAEPNHATLRGGPVEIDVHGFHTIHGYARESS